MENTEEVRFGWWSFRALKGAPMTLLTLIAFTQKPADKRWLEAVSGYSDKTVTKALRILEMTNFARYYKTGWILGPINPFYSSTVEEKREAEKTEFLDNDGGMEEFEAADEESEHGEMVVEELGEEMAEELSRVEEFPDEFEEGVGDEEGAMEVRATGVNTLGRRGWMGKAWDGGGNFPEVGKNSGLITTTTAFNNLINLISSSSSSSRYRKKARLGGFDAAMGEVVGVVRPSPARGRIYFNHEDTKTRRNIRKSIFLPRTLKCATRDTKTRREKCYSRRVFFLPRTLKCAAL